jgi:cytidyltransferase-like protein
MIVKGITFSSFDLFHSGHVAMLKEARANCDYLMVGLQTDPTIDRPEKNKPIHELLGKKNKDVFKSEIIDIKRNFKYINIYNKNMN